MAWFRENPAGIAAMARSPAMQAAMHRRTTRGRNFALLISPYRTGRYSRSFRIITGIHRGKAWSRLINIAPYAIYLEYGTRYMKRQRILGRALVQMSNDRSAITLNN